MVALNSVGSSNKLAMGLFDKNGLREKFDTIQFSLFSWESLWVYMSDFKSVSRLNWAETKPNKPMMTSSFFSFWNNFEKVKKTNIGHHPNPTFLSLSGKQTCPILQEND